MTDLPRDVAEEIRRVARFGRAGGVRQDVTDAAAAFDEGRLDDAVELLERAKHHAPRSPTIRALAGLVRYHREEWQQTTRELATYRRLSGKFDQDPVYADALRALGRPERAIEVLEALDPSEVPEEVYAEALVVRAGALRDVGRLDDALDVLQSGPLQPKVVQPHHLRLWYALADALEADGRRAEARPWWDAIYAEEPLFFDVSRRRLGVRG